MFNFGVINDSFVASYTVGQPKFWGDFASNSIIEFDPNRDSIPIFGSLQRHLTTTQELGNRPF